MKATLTGCSAIVVAVALCGDIHAQQVLSLDGKPKVGEESSEGDQCFARVSVPAVYRTEDVKTQTRAEIARFKITPSVFKNGTKTVTLAPAHSEIEAIQPEIEEITETFEVLPASSGWVRGSLDGEVPVSKGELIDMVAAGVDVENVEAGLCFVEHITEATLQDIPTKVLISEATEKLSVEDAVLKDEQVSVETKPAFTRLVEVPPSFKDGIEKVEVATATKRWETECGAVQKIEHMTGETLCLVDVPPQFEDVPTKSVDVPALIKKVEKEAETEQLKSKILVSDAEEVRNEVAEEYDNIDRQRISKPAQLSWLAKGKKPEFGAKPTGRTACFVETPAKMAEYTRKVVKTPGRFVTKEIPAKTTTVDIEELVSAATSTPFNEPATFETVQRKIKTGDAKIDWQPVLCQVNFSTDIITQIQKALANEGFNPGPVDGIMGLGTTRAINQFQEANQLADGGLTIETLKKLGVRL